MAQHGYLHDEYDRGDFGGDRDRDERWRDRDDDRRFLFDRNERERGWRGGDEGRGRARDRDDDGFFSRMGDRARSWTGDEDDDRGRWSRERDSSRSDANEWFGGGTGGGGDEWQQRDRGTSGYGREHGVGGFQGDYSRSGRQQGGFGGAGDWTDRDRGSRSGSSLDDHYLSWRQKQIEALDRDYQDYCRECEQRFHQDFDSWRQNRPQGQGQTQGQTQGGQTQGQGQGQAQGRVRGQHSTAGQAAGSETPMELNQPASGSGETTGTTSPMSEATLGTNNSENTTTGRGRR